MKSNNRYIGIIERKSIVWTAKQVSRMVGNNAINFDHIVQRSYVWERERKSKLIESILLGYPVPSVWAKSRDAIEGEVSGRGNKVYVILDGKQRLSTIKEFLNDEFAMTTTDSFIYEDENGEEQEANITGKKFSELPKEMQEYVESVCIGVNYFDTLDDDGQRELFNRLNNGKPLSTKSKTLANCKCIVDIMEIGKHEIFNEMLSDKARANKNQVTIIFKIWEMMNLPIEYVDFTSKSFNEVVSNTEINEVEKDNIIKMLDFMKRVHEIVGVETEKIAKKFYNETNFVSLIPYAEKAMELENSVDEFSKFTLYFFKEGKTTSISELYNASNSNGTAKSYNIIGRNTALANEFDKFFAEVLHNEEDYEEEIFEEDNSEDEIEFDEAV